MKIEMICRKCKNIIGFSGARLSKTSAGNPGKTRLKTPEQIWEEINNGE